MLAMTREDSQCCMTALADGTKLKNMHVVFKDGRQNPELRRIKGKLFTLSGNNWNEQEAYN